MVGHTHEDIDACFSKVADKLRRNDAETLDDLIALLPSVTVINYVYDVRTWIQDSICDLRKHTRPLHYKLRSNDAIVETFYKGKYDSPWKKLEGGILARDNNHKIRTIRGSPKLSQINFDGIGLQKISSHLNHWKCLFSDQIDLGGKISLSFGRNVRKMPLKDADNFWQTHNGYFQCFQNNKQLTKTKKSLYCQILFRI